MPTENLQRIQTARFMERQFGLTHSQARRALQNAVAQKTKAVDKPREEVYPISLQQEKSVVQRSTETTRALAPLPAAQSATAITLPTTPQEFDLVEILAYVKAHLHTDYVETCAGTVTFYAPDP